MASRPFAASQRTMLTTRSSGLACTPWSGRFNYDPSDDVLQHYQNDQPSVTDLTHLPFRKSVGAPRPPKEIEKMVFVCPKPGCFQYRAEERHLRGRHIEQAHGRAFLDLTVKKLPIAQVNSSMIAFAGTLPPFRIGNPIVCPDCQLATESKAAKNLEGRRVCPPCWYYFKTHKSLRPSDLVCIFAAQQKIDQALNDEKQHLHKDIDEPESKQSSRKRDASVTFDEGTTKHAAQISKRQRRH